MAAGLGQRETKRDREDPEHDHEREASGCPATLGESLGMNRIPGDNNGYHIPADAETLVSPANNQYAAAIFGQMNRRQFPVFICRSRKWPHGRRGMWT